MTFETSDLLNELEFFIKQNLMCKNNPPLFNSRFKVSSPQNSIVIQIQMTNDKFIINLDQVQISLEITTSDKKLFLVVCYILQLYDNATFVLNNCSDHIKSKFQPNIDQIDIQDQNSSEFYIQQLLTNNNLKINIHTELDSVPEQKPQDKIELQSEVLQQQQRQYEYEKLSILQFVNDLSEPKTSIQNIQPMQNGCKYLLVHESMQINVRGNQIVVQFRKNTFNLQLDASLASKVLIYFLITLRNTAVQLKSNVPIVIDECQKILNKCNCRIYSAPIPIFAIGDDDMSLLQNLTDVRQKLYLTPSDLRVKCNERMNGLFTRLLTFPQGSELKETLVSDSKKLILDSLDQASEDTVNQILEQIQALAPNNQDNSIDTTQNEQVQEDQTAIQNINSQQQLNENEKKKRVRVRKPKQPTEPIDSSEIDSKITLSQISQKDNEQKSQKENEVKKQKDVKKPNNMIQRFEYEFEVNEDKINEIMLKLDQYIDNYEIDSQED
ncbi:Hypothetical_protein [Hexamita inflata]|uniref:Hypothetical_protein n=1 Tax=Hexamita inflata TaxID=28002 RepID=A0AA86TLM5_9EUKA|nr:Hypothetical protein HINF_LOCUS9974 [Hexamita inflata]